MTSAVPIIRAGAIAPMLRWLGETGEETETWLANAALNDYPTDDALAPIPFRGAVMLLRDIARSKGADAPFRLLDDGGFHEIGLLSRMSTAGRTPRQVLELVVTAMRFHCSHEFLKLDQRDRHLNIRYGMQLNLPDAESNHAVQQYTLAVLAKIFEMSGATPPFFDRIQLVPHPEHGFAHLRDWIGTGVSPVPGRALEVSVPDAIANRPVRGHPEMAAGGSATERHRLLRTDGSVSASIALLVRSMMRKTKPTIDRIARSTGMSRRTLQRAIAREGQDFSSILDTARKAYVMKALSDGETTMADLSAHLGYAHQATLSRALRRWAIRSDNLSDR